MKDCFVASELSRAVVFAGLTIASAFPAFAQPRTSEEALIITLYSDRYVAEGQVFTDPDALDDWVQRKRPTKIHLDVCEPAANLRLLAAAYEFREFKLELRPMVTGQAVCSQTPVVQAVRVSGAVRTIATRTDKEVVDLYWRNVMP